jgi:hypothetical protein
MSHEYSAILQMILFSLFDNTYFVWSTEMEVEIVAKDDFWGKRSGARGQGHSHFRANLNDGMLSSDPLKRPTAKAKGSCFLQLGSATFCFLEIDGGEVLLPEPGLKISVRAFDANHCPGEHVYVKGFHAPAKVEFCSDFSRASSSKLSC